MLLNIIKIGGNVIANLTSGTMIQIIKSSDDLKSEDWTQIEFNLADERKRGWVKKLNFE